MIDGGWLGDMVDKKPRIDSLVCSSVKYPRMKVSIEIICLEPSENLAVEYGGFIFGISTWEGIKLWKIMNLLGKSSARYSWVKAFIDKGTTWGSGYNCSIWLIDWVVIVKSICLSAFTTALWSGS